MNINKAIAKTTEIADKTLKNLTSKIVAPKVKSTSNSKALLNELDAMASCAKTSIIHSKKGQNIPEFIYHITSKENYKKILKDGKMNISAWEELSENGCQGIYFIDKENFLKNWVGRKEPELFGDVDLGELLMLWTSKGTDTVAIKIPTSSLDMSKLHFRPYIKASREATETIDNDTLKISSNLVKEGLPICELAKYAETDEPIEYVYFGKITPKLFQGHLETKYFDNPLDMIKSLFS